MNMKMQEERDDLLLSGINLYRRFKSLDRDAVVQYDVFDVETHDNIVKPWMKLKMECIAWLTEIIEFMNKNKVDKGIWCELFLFDPLTFGLGTGGEYTSKLLNQIEFQIKTTIEILKNEKVNYETNTSLDMIQTETQITKMIFVKRNNNKRQYSLVLNNNFNNSLPCDRNKGTWDKLYRLAEGEIISAEGETNFINYMNVNCKNKIYTRTKFDLTKIIEITENYMRLAVEIEMITEKAFKTRLGKQIKLLKIT